MATLPWPPFRRRVAFVRPHEPLFSCDTEVIVRFGNAGIIVQTAVTIVDIIVNVVVIVF